MQVGHVVKECFPEEVMLSQGLQDREEFARLRGE